MTLSGSICALTRCALRSVPSLILLGGLVAAVGHVAAQSREPIEIDLPAQPLEQALLKLAEIQKAQVVYVLGDVKPFNAPALRGRLTTAQAVERLLAGTNLTYAVSQNGAVVIKPAASGNTPESQGAHSENPTVPAQAQVPAPSASDPTKGMKEHDGKEPGAERRVEKIVVMGTNIRGVAPTGSPFRVITRESIDAAGFASVPDLVRSIPQNYGAGASESTNGVSLNQDAARNPTFASGINLRGLGNFSTLTLVNGRRVPRTGTLGANFDVSMIPLSAVERVEILTDGASAVYGSDAVGGVVNLQLRRDFDGAESSLQVGSVTSGAMNEFRASHAQGWRWGDGHLLGAIEIYRRDNLDSSDRAFFTDNLTRYGGPDLRSTFSNPGNIIRGSSIRGIPAGQDGRSLTPGAILPTANLQDSKEGRDILPEQQRQSLFLLIDQDISNTTTVFGELMYGRREFEGRQGGSTATLSVNPTHPFYVNPFGGANTPVQIRYSFLDDLGPITTSGTSRMYSAALGLDISLGRTWAGKVFGSYGRADEAYVSRNFVNTFYSSRALGLTDRNLVFNPFGDGSNSAATTIEGIRGYADNTFTNRASAVVAKADGSLIELGAGEAKLATGVEIRREFAEQLAQVFVSTATPNTTTNLQRSRQVRAAFAEVHLPLVSDRNRFDGTENLSLSIAGRVDRYSDFGNTSNPKLGVSWEPVKGLRTRASYGTAFRAPSFIETSTLAQEFVRSQVDPGAATGTSTVLIRSGPDPNLSPEKATVSTAGLDIAPAALPGFEAQLTLFSIRYKDRIALLNVTQVLSDPGLALLVNRNPSLAEINSLVALPTFTGYIGVPPDPASVQVIIDSRTRNLSLEDQRGLDFDLGYRRRLTSGEVGLTLNGTWIRRFRQQLSAIAPRRDVLDTLNYPVDLRLRGGATWRSGPLNIALFVNYTDSYRNTLVTPNAKVSSWTTCDLSARYAPSANGILKGVSVFFFVQNLLDRDPPYALTTSGSATAPAGIGYDPQQASPLGRFIGVRLAKQW